MDHRSELQQLKTEAMRQGLMTQKVHDDLQRMAAKLDAERARVADLESLLTARPTARAEVLRLGLALVEREAQLAAAQGKLEACHRVAELEAQIAAAWLEQRDMRVAEAVMQACIDAVAQSMRDGEAWSVDLAAVVAGVK